MEVIEQLTAKQKIRWSFFWSDHAKSLMPLLDRTDRNRLEEEVLFRLLCLTQPPNIGFAQSMVRPGNVGKWDVFRHLVFLHGEKQARVASGLKCNELAKYRKQHPTDTARDAW